MSDPYLIQVLSVLRKHLFIDQFDFSSVFSAVSRQTSYDFGILRQDYGIIRGLMMDHTRFTDWSTSIQADLMTVSDQTVQAVHSCNSWV